MVLENVRERIRQDPGIQAPRRRRRLLSPDPEERAPEPEVVPVAPQSDESKAYKPQAMNDDVHERMWFDPEVQVRVKWLRWGGGILAGVVLVTVIADRMKWWTGVSQYFANVTDRILRTSESFKSASEANDRESSYLPKKKPVAKTVPAPTLTPVKKNSGGPNSITNQEAALKAVGSFLNASTLMERIKYVRRQELWGPRMQEYYVRNRDGPVLFDRVEAVEGGAKDDKNFIFSVVLSDGQRRKIEVGQSSAGDFLVDWASFVLYSEMDWDKFRSNRPTEPVTFRVLAMPSDYFENGFTDSKNLVCLKLANPLNSSEPPLYAYADRNSTAGRSLAYIVQTYAGKAVPLILRLRYPAPSVTENQVLIGEFVGEGWVAQSW